MNGEVRHEGDSMRIEMDTNLVSMKVLMSVMWSMRVDVDDVVVRWPPTVQLIFL